MKEVNPNKLTITSDAGVSVSINLLDGAQVLQLAPGSTDMKSAQSVALESIQIGDRVLVIGHQDSSDVFMASRVILMKSRDIVRKREAEQGDWQKHGTGGPVSQVDTASGTIAITAQGNNIRLKTSPSTIYRRYAPGSVKYEDALPGTLGEIQVGDLLRVRGNKRDDSSIDAEEVVSGSFRNAEEVVNGSFPHASAPGVNEEIANAGVAQAAATNSPTTGPYYALVIGNDDYHSLPKLKTATSDATALAQVLREQYGFSTSVLLNATRADIIGALLTYRRKLPEKSNLLVYYAGHGANDSEARVAYWLPVDARLGDTTNWISSDDITAELRVIKALHILVVADSCYSGALMRSADFVDIDAELKPSERDFYIEKLQSLKSRNLLASGGVEPVADGGTLNHSIFAAVMLQSLTDMKEPEFTASLLFQKLVVRVAGRSQQTPQYNPIVNSQHDGGDFVFFRQLGTTAPPVLCCTQQAAATPVYESRLAPNSFAPTPLAPTPLAPTPATRTNSTGMLGRWLPAPGGQEGNSLGHLEITLVGNTVNMHAFGNCHEPICDWGTRPAVFDGTNTTAIFNIHAPGSTSQRIAKVTIHPVSDGLDVVVENVITGPSGPSNKQSHRTFSHSP